MKLYEVNGTYGSGKTPCTVFVAETDQGNWYAVNGSKNVNFTLDDPIEEGVDVEYVSDYDTFTAGKPIESLRELEEAINS